MRTFEIKVGEEYLLRKVRKADAPLQANCFPMAIQRVQTDNGNEFGTDSPGIRDLGIAHRYIPPGCPEVNGKVELSHRTDGEE